jgi:phosphoserine aminotransferase
LREAGKAAVNFNNSGLSILEISHRSADFVAVLEEAESLTRELLNIDDNYAVLFLQGGASSQFFMSAMNLLDSEGKACYVDTGAWSTKAIKEAGKFGKVEVIASSKEKNYNYIPKRYKVPTDATYLHLTSNNTIFGTQYNNWWPDTEVPFVADMSSDIFSRPIDINRFGMIYAGAQKNMGPSGITLVIIRKDLLGKVNREIPTMLDYNTHIKKGSAFNTPPVFPIYVSMLTMRWVKEKGGVEEMFKKNRSKAGLLYREIDKNPLFYGTAAKKDRSQMNVTFLLKQPDLQEDFLKACADAGCVGIKGHRSVGGFRASIYNAMPRSSVKVLTEVMADLAQKFA